MAQRLELSKNRLRNQIHTGKPREWEQLTPHLKHLIGELCEGRRKWPLFLHGSTGTGKSCAALCIVDRVANSEFWALPALVRFVESVKLGREEWYQLGRGGSWTERGWWHHISNLQLLVLDDVGMRELNNKELETEMETLFLALEARDGKPLVCTSNLDADDIKFNYNERIHSRMCSGVVYELGGDDRRFA